MGIPTENVGKDMESLVGVYGGPDSPGPCASQCCVGFSGEGGKVSASGVDPGERRGGVRANDP